MRVQDLLLAKEVSELPAWWERIDDDPKWQEYVFVVLSAAYGLLALVALVQVCSASCWVYLLCSMPSHQCHELDGAWHKFLRFPR